MKTHNVRAVSFHFIWGFSGDYSPGDSLSDNSVQLLWRSMIFQHSLYLVRTKNVKQVRDISKLRKNKTKTHEITDQQYTASQYGLGTWEENEGGKGSN